MDEEDICLLNVEVTTVAGKFRLKLVTDQRKITHSVIIYMSHEINTSVPNTPIPTEWQNVMIIHGPVTDIRMFF